MAATVLLKVNVAYPKEFIQQLEDQADERQALGETSWRYGWDKKTGNVIWAILDWKAYDKAEAYFKSADRKQQLETAKPVECDVTLLETE